MIYKCKNCGGNTIYNPEKKKMLCPNCTGEDSEEIVYESEADKCVMCGGSIAYKDFVSATKCEYCGAYQIMRERVEGEYEPQLILPFEVSRKQAEELLRNEFQARVFTPPDFMSQASIEKMEGNYVPFWMFDYSSRYVYDGVGTKVRTWRSGDKEYTETSKYQVRRDLQMEFEKIPADASVSMDDGIMDLMEPYEYDDLIEFDPKYMSGFLGEIYNDTMDKFEPRAKKKAQDAAETVMNKSFAGYASVTPSNRDLTISPIETRYALMPVWVYTYRFRGKSYPLYVNGQTGKIVGKTPISKERILTVTASLFGVIVLTGGLLLKLMEVLL